MHRRNFLVAVTVGTLLGSGCGDAPMEPSAQPSETAPSAAVAASANGFSTAVSMTFPQEHTYDLSVAELAGFSLLAHANFSAYIQHGALDTRWRHLIRWAKLAEPHCASFPVTWNEILKLDYRNLENGVLYNWPGAGVFSPNSYGAFRIESRSTLFWNSINMSDAADSRCVVLRYNSVPPAPAWITINNRTSHSSHPNVSWASSQFATGYRLYRMITGVNPHAWTQIASGGLGRLDETVSINTSACTRVVHYRATALNHHGESQPSSSTAVCIH
jgi:hypothetical protein